MWRAATSWPRLPPWLLDGWQVLQAALLLLLQGAGLLRALGSTHLLALLRVHALLLLLGAVLRRHVPLRLLLLHHQRCHLFLLLLRKGCLLQQLLPCQLHLPAGTVGGRGRRVDLKCLLPSLPRSLRLRLLSRRRALQSVRLLVR